MKAWTQAESQRIVVPVLVAVVALALWQGLVVAFKVPHFIVPAPSHVAQVMVADAALLFGALLNTLKITLLSFAAAVLLGVLVAFAFVQSRLVEVAFFPYAVLTARERSSRKLPEGNSSSSSTVP